MTSMRRRYVASTSLRRHVPAGNLASLAPPPPPQYPKLCLSPPPPPPEYSEPSYAYASAFGAPSLSLISYKLKKIPVFRTYEYQKNRIYHRTLRNPGRDMRVLFFNLFRRLNMLFERLNILFAQLIILFEQLNMSFGQHNILFEQHN